MTHYNHIDINILTQVADGNWSLIRDLNNLLEKKIHAFANQMEEQYNNGDIIALSRLLHNIAGSLSTLGIMKLAKQIKIFEKITKSGKYPENFCTFIESFRRTSLEAIEEINLIITTYKLTNYVKH